MPRYMSEIARMPTTTDVPIKPPRSPLPFRDERKASDHDGDRQERDRFRRMRVPGPTLRGSRRAAEGRAMAMDN